MRAAWGYDQPNEKISQQIKVRMMSMPGLSKQQTPEDFRRAQAYKSDAFLSKVEVAEQRDLETLSAIAMEKMRAVAVDKMLDMTDALDEMAGTGYDKNVGTMDRQRFVSTLGVLFAGSLSQEDLKLFCIKYGCDGADPQEPDVQLKVDWKQFAIDFDNIPAPPDPVPDPRRMMKHLMELRAHAVQMRLDMSDAFEEYTGSLKERNSGTMAKNRFRATMGHLFAGKIDPSVLNEICREYGIGDPDPREGGFMRVRWKLFADTFDEVPPMPPPEPPDPTPEILEYMRGMNEYCNLHAIDLENDIEEYLGGKDACTSDLMPTGKFERAIGVLLGKASNSYPHESKMLNLISQCYAAGPKSRRNPLLSEQVQWREFAKDLRAVQPMPYLRSITGKVKLYPQAGEMAK